MAVSQWLAQHWIDLVLLGLVIGAVDLINEAVNVLKKILYLSQAQAEIIETNLKEINQDIAGLTSDIKDIKYELGNINDELRNIENDLKPPTNPPFELDDYEL